MKNKNNINLFIQILINFLLIIPYVISLLIPKNKNIWVFGSWMGQRYSDNSRYVYEYVLSNEKTKRAIWLTRDKQIKELLESEGKEVYLINSLKGFWFTCRSSIVFICSGLWDVNRIGASRALKVQLWHGTPLKKIGLDDNITLQKENRLLKILRKVWRKLFQSWDLIISPSENIVPRLSSAFGVDKSKIKVTGYPRADKILDENPQIVSFLEERKKMTNFENVIAYIPTHRGQGDNNFNLLRNMNVGKMEDCLKELNAVLIIKMHFYHKHEVININKENSRIIFCEEKELPDVNFLLPFVDILITDYSSVYFDYLLLNRPIIFTPFDYEEYLEKDRELYDEYEKVTPGPLSYSWDEVIYHLYELNSGIDAYKVERKKINNYFNQYYDKDNCKRVVEEAEALLKSN